VSRIPLLQREHQLYAINHDHTYISQNKERSGDPQEGHKLATVNKEVLEAAMIYEERLKLANGLEMNDEGLEMNKEGLEMNKEGLEMNQEGLEMNNEGLEMNKEELEMDEEGLEMNEGLEVVTMNEGLELSTTMMNEEGLEGDDHDQLNETTISPEIHEITIPVEVGKDVECLCFTMNCSVSLT